MAKILLVEDDESEVRLYQRIFTHEGYEVVVATNGREGIAKVHETTPDIILLDIMMPTMNGLDALELLQADIKTKHIPVIMLTNLNSTKEQEEELLNKGVVKYLVKSQVEPTELIQIVRDVIAAYKH